ncbi:MULTISPECIES: Plug domain-containing protein [unclassified Allomuricauda]|jgi:outer membrane receptor protein involved in Fe transport|uniref:TonB-dependent receptor n=1 Tax=Flagellimonas sp. TaxID=2058762 RepID=UPI000E21E03D|nr:Plug domain-containing protein [Allomuricauda sp.]
MKQLFTLSVLFLVFSLVSCSGSKSTAYNPEIAKELEQRNKGNISLLQRIRQLPGVTLRNGLPYFVKASNQVFGQQVTEPLYVLNGYIVGNSFRSVDQLVNSFMVESIEALTGAETAEYGSRGASGVIKIKTIE